MDTVRDKLTGDEPTIGSWIQLGDEALVEMMATGLFDWLCVDMEHTTIGIDRCGRAIRVAQLAGCPVLVRLSSHSPSEIKKVLDAGADGIIAPQVNTAAQATSIVSASTYPPKGTRGVGLARAQRYGVGFEDYLERSGTDQIRIMQIEHVDGVANIEEILAVPGVDGIFVGPYDLSASLGHPGEFTHPDVISALQTVEAAASRPGVVAGIHVVEPSIADLESASARGYRMIAFASDMLLFAYEMERVAAAIGEVRGAR